MTALFLALLLSAYDTWENAEPEPKLSLLVLSDEDAWREPGLRLALGYSMASFEGIDGVPGGVRHAASVRVGARIDEHWSLLGSANYGGFARGPDSGFHFSGTIEPTLHLEGGLSISVGIGLQGLIASREDAPSALPRDGIEASYTLPSADPLLGECDGSGFLVLGRADYALILGQSFAMGPGLQLESDWTQCSDELGRRDPDTAAEIELHQYWQHVGVSLGWMVWWR